MWIRVMPASSSPALARLQKVSSLSALGLLVSLPFLVPYGDTRDIDMQGILIIVAGGAAGLALLLRWSRPNVDTKTFWVLALFFSSYLLSYLLNSPSVEGLFGAPVSRIGLLSLLAFMCLGLLVSTIKDRDFTKYVYLITILAAVISLPYSFFINSSLERMGGVLSQADIFACFMAIGLLISFKTYQIYVSRKRWIAATQFYFIILILLSGTRAVITILAGMALVFIISRPAYFTSKKLLAVLLTGSILIGAIWGYLPDRLSDPQYARESIVYRIDLQSRAADAAVGKPWGYGVGNISEALTCSSFESKELIATCKEGYYFNSSHNIFLDRVLEAGWVAGLSYLVLIGLAMYRAYQTPATRTWAVVLILISCYYLTNVTNGLLELVFWLILFRFIVQNPNSSTKKT